MQAMLSIRKQIFRMSQTAFALAVGVNQSTVSRWERGDLEPSRNEMAAIRKLAFDQGLEWDDRWFFEIPPDQPGQPSAPAVPAVAAGAA